MRSMVHQTLFRSVLDWMGLNQNYRFREGVQTVILRFVNSSDGICGKLREILPLSVESRIYYEYTKDNIKAYYLVFRCMWLFVWPA